MNNKKKSQLQEKEIAKKFGGDVVIASGAFWSSKGDVRNDAFLVECKFTSKDRFQLSKKVWKKICDEAIKDGLRLPVLVIYLFDGKEKLVLVPIYYFEEEENLGLEITLSKALWRDKYTTLSLKNINCKFLTESDCFDFVVMRLEDFIEIAEKKGDIA